MNLQEVWVMPPLHHRLFDFFKRIAVQQEQPFTIRSIIRYMSWFEESEWKEPTKQEVIDILKWLHENDFLYVRFDQDMVYVTVNLNQVTLFEERPSEFEYHQLYAQEFLRHYQQLFGMPFATKKDIQAIYELSKNDIPLKRCLTVLEELSHKYPYQTIPMVRDYIFASVCFELVA